jgi:CO/xanthine dehydrogenase FAD-binding subunit
MWPWSFCSGGQPSFPDLAGTPAIKGASLTSRHQTGSIAAMNDFTTVSRLDDALRVLDAAAVSGSAVAPIAGGTDIYPAATSRQAWFGEGTGRLLDVAGVEGMTGIRRSPEGTVIGACTSWTALAEAMLPPAFHALQAAARQVGGRQIQNRGTIGGNLCNASPAADGVPPLLALDATVELKSVEGTRTLPLASFISGNRRTERRPNELLTRILIPPAAAGERSVFLKLGARSYLVISIASVAANVDVGSDGRIVSARIALGACSAAPLRLHRIEAALVGQSAAPLSVSLGPDDGLSPLDDVRASAAYRTRAAEVLVARAVLDCLAPLRRAA